MADNLTGTTAVIGATFKGDSYQISDGSTYKTALAYDPTDADTLQIGVDSLRVAEVKTDCLLPYINNGVVGKLDISSTYTAIDFNNIPVLNWNGP